MLVITNPSQDLHRIDLRIALNGREYEAREGPERVEAIRTVLEAVEGFEFEEAEPAAREDIHRHHQYADFLERACERIADREDQIIAWGFPVGVPGQLSVEEPQFAQIGMMCSDMEAPVEWATYRAAMGSADAAVTAARRLAAEKRRAVYSLSRPPGHHAGPNQFGGFCYFNNSAAAARELRRHFQRVAILDFDHHHGNGTQTLFYGDGSVLTISLHGDPNEEYPYFTGYTNEHGTGDGEGANVNFPLPLDTEGPAYLAAMEKALQAVADFGAEALVVAAGFDSHRADPIGGMGLEVDDYGDVGRLVASAGLPTAIVQEGGYDPDMLAQCAGSFLRPFRT